MLGETFFPTSEFQEVHQESVDNERIREALQPDFRRATVFYHSVVHRNIFYSAPFGRNRVLEKRDLD